MKAIASSFVVGSVLLFASTVFATDNFPPLTRGDCSNAGMRWDEGANVCTEPTSTDGQTESSTEFPAATISQPLTRTDCGKAGLRWDEAANVCAELTSTAGQAEAGPDSRSSNVLITIDKTHQKMTIFVDGERKYEWRVSTGRPGYATPSGTYAATSMNEVWYSKEWDNAPMPNSIFFTKAGHAIHGSFEVKKLGKAASHGCVRISPTNAATLYGLVGKNGLENTQVVLNGVTPGGEFHGREQGER